MMREERSERGRRSSLALTALFSRCHIIWALLLVALPLAGQGRQFSDSALLSQHQLSDLAISRDGRSLAWTTWSVDSASGAWRPMVWQSRSDGKEALALAPGYGAVWSPDGRSLAWITADSGGSQVMTHDLRSGETRTVASQDGRLEELGWSPDGSVLVFAAWVANAVPRNDAGTALAKALRGAARPGGPPPDTRRHLFALNLTDGTRRDLTPGPMQVGSLDLASPAGRTWSWFPDGRHLAFEGNSSPEADHQYRSSAIWFVPLSGGQPGLLTTGPGFWHSPAVSPDGRWIAYTGSPAGETEYHAEDLYVMLPDGSGVRRLTANLERDPVAPVWSDERTLWFSAVDGGAVNIHTASLTAGEGVKAVTNGNHTLILGALTTSSGGFGVAVRSGVLSPPELVRFSLKRPSDLRELFQPTLPEWGELSLGESEDVYFPSPVGTVQGVLFRPPGFNPSQSYPLLIELGAGPHSNSLGSFDPTSLWFAAQGYLVFRLNPRGSVGQGDIFASVDSFPAEAARDVLSGLNAVRQLGAVDTSRIMLHGCGAGAVTAIHLLTLAQAFARASVDCTGGDWLGQAAPPLATAPGQPFFLRRLGVDPLVWAEDSPVRYASLIRTPLLILAGACDLAASSSLARPLYQALLLRGTGTALLTVPGSCPGSAASPGARLQSLRARLQWYQSQPEPVSRQ